MTEQTIEAIKKTNVWAIISLVSGLSFFAGIPVVGSLIALITGNIAKKEIKASNGEMKGENLAVIGVAVGWLGLFVWGVGGLCAFVLSITGVLVGGFSVIALITLILEWLRSAFS